MKLTRNTASSERGIGQDRAQVREGPCAGNSRHGPKEASDPNVNGQETLVVTNTLTASQADTGVDSWEADREFSNYLLVKHFDANSEEDEPVEGWQEGTDRVGGAAEAGEVDKVVRGTGSLAAAAPTVEQGTEAAGAGAAAATGAAEGPRAGHAQTGDVRHNTGRPRSPGDAVTLYAGGGDGGGDGGGGGDGDHGGGNAGGGSGRDDGGRRRRGRGAGGAEDADHGRAGAEGRTGSQPPKRRQAQLEVTDTSDVGEGSRGRDGDGDRIDSRRSGDTQRHETVRGSNSQEGNKGEPPVKRSQHDGNGGEVFA